MSHNAAKEMVNLTARVPLAYRIVSGAVKARFVLLCGHCSFEGAAYSVGVLCRPAAFH